MIARMHMWTAGVLVLAVAASLSAGNDQGRGALDDGLVLFGDSLLDVGNTYRLSGGFAPPSPFYWEGRFSNGPLWVEHVAEALGQPTPVPARDGGSSYAFGGSQTADHPGPIPEVDLPDLDEQVEMYVSGLDPHDRRSRHDLHVVWSGANDFLLGEQTDPAASVDNVAAQLENLYDAGARQMLVPNLPPLGRVPLAVGQGPAVSQSLNKSSHDYNVLLEQALQGMEDEHPDLRIYRMDVEGAVQDMLANPDAFGFENVAEPALGSIGIFDPDFGAHLVDPADNPDDYLFWDGAHPTAATHRLLAQVAIDSLGDLIPPGQYATDTRLAARDMPAAIPEPATLTTLLLLAGGTIIRRRKR